MRDLVERQAVIDAYCEHECGKSLNWRNCGTVDCGHIFDNVPSAQPEPLTEEEMRLLKKLRSYHNGSYAKLLDKLVASAQPEPQCDECPERQEARQAIAKYLSKEPQWIPCSKPPKESGTYIVTAYDGIDKRVTFVKYQKALKRWDLTGARAYWRILAYKPLPEPWRGEEDER